MAQQGKRFKAKVAPKISDTGGYCSAKKMHYYDVKIHILRIFIEGSLPIPEYIEVTHVGMNNVKVYEPV